MAHQVGSVGSCYPAISILLLLTATACSGPETVPSARAGLSAAGGAAAAAGTAAPQAAPSPTALAVQQAGWAPPGTSSANPRSLPPVGGPPAAADAWPQHPLTSTSSPDVYDPTVTVATVGDQHILRGDLLGDANIMLAPHLEKVPADQLESRRAQILSDRDQMAKQLLSQAIQRKLMYLAFLRSIPVEKRQEAQATMKTRIGSVFQSELEKMIENVANADPSEYESLAQQDAQLFRLAYLMKQQQLSSRRELEQYLRRYGSSLEKQQQSFAELKLGQQVMFSAIDTKPEVTHDEMLQYYRRNVTEFQVPDQARWEQLTARFDHFNDRAECRQAIAAMGNEVFLGGAPLAAVARRSSHGSQASEGGYHDWTEWGDLEVSREIQQQVFALPPGKLSEIIEDSEGLHIVRVIEQRAAHVIPFSDAQATIKRKLQVQKRNEQVLEFITKQRDATPIWTIYDGELSPARVADPSSPAAPPGSVSR